MRRKVPPTLLHHRGYAILFWENDASPIHPLPLFKGNKEECATWLFVRKMCVCVCCVWIIHITIYVCLKIKALSRAELPMPWSSLVCAMECKTRALGSNNKHRFVNHEIIPSAHAVLIDVDLFQIRKFWYDKRNLHFEELMALASPRGATMPLYTFSCVESTQQSSLFPGLHSNKTALYTAIHIQSIYNTCTPKGLQVRFGHVPPLVI